jgi:hypothetical protein
VTSATLTADTFWGAYNAMMRQGYSEPSFIVMHPDHWRDIRIIQRSHEIFKKRIKRDWVRFKSKYRPNWHARWLQRLYVRYVRDQSVLQATHEIAAEELARFF